MEPPGPKAGPQSQDTVPITELGPRPRTRADQRGNGPVGQERSVCALGAWRKQLGNQTRDPKSWMQETVRQVEMDRSTTTSLRKEGDRAKGKGLGELAEGDEEQSKRDRESRANGSHKVYPRTPRY